VAFFLAIYLFIYLFFKRKGDFVTEFSQSFFPFSKFKKKLALLLAKK
jgi:hypothetical protein